MQDKDVRVLVGELVALERASKDVQRAITIIALLTNNITLPIKEFQKEHQEKLTQVVNSPCTVTDAKRLLSKEIGWVNEIIKASVDTYNNLFGVRHIVTKGQPQQVADLIKATSEFNLKFPD